VCQSSECLRSFKCFDDGELGGFSTVHLTDSRDFVAVKVFWMVGLVVFLKAEGYPFPVMLKRTRGSVLEEESRFKMPAFGTFRMVLLFLSCQWGPVSCFSLGTSLEARLLSVFPRSLPSFLPFLVSLYGHFLRCLFLARPVCSDSFASVVYPATSFMDAFDPNICIGIDSASVLFPVTSSSKVVSRPKCAGIEV
jgi:hypothetical protein